MEKTRDFGFHIYLRGIILLGFTLLFFKLLVTGNITNFIAPRMMPFMYFAAATLFILGIIQIWRSGSKNQEELVCNCGFDHGDSSTPIKSILIYSIFVIPIMTGFMFPDNVLDSSIIDKRGFTSSKQIVEERQQAGAFDGSTENSTNPGESSTSRAEAYLEDPEKYMDEQDSEDGPTIDEKLADAPLEHPEGFELMDPPEGYYEEIKAEMLKMDTIIVDDERYIPMMNILDVHMDEFEGKRIEMIGFVYREEDFTKDQFVVARFGLSCCVADASVYGTLSNMIGADELKNDEWVKISGTVSTTQYNNFFLPYIHVDTLEKVEQPDSPYIYEYY
ncbi:TIGR03943 family putative permease subunit [Sutcliffiella rhizosphaerae]|uniref:Two-component membrane permease complex subunit SMU_746c n=1 Tax=Sutcliffiella rhizosphaerae TaxID=2880967 RepID=A0ABM8YR21_9BACI|nr:TIGR03943 family protein [Sutcliffiella rhizosphaerae]CAG9622421.1 Putative two-component membrane permease complex subunit SMU_746c [Sutcliffiella rhizosphaerae]